MKRLQKKVKALINRKKEGHARRQSVGLRIKYARGLLRKYQEVTGKLWISDEKEFLVAKELYLTNNGIEGVMFVFTTVMWVLKQVISLVVIITGAKAFYERLIELSFVDFLIIYFGIDIIEKIILKLADVLSKKHKVIEQMGYEEWKKWLSWDENKRVK